MGGRWFCGEAFAHFDENGTGQPLSRAYTTLAERLSEAGWSTLGLAANHVFFGRGFGLEQGFEAFEARPPNAYRMLHEGGRWPSFSVTGRFI